MLIVSFDSVYLGVYALYTCSYVFFWYSCFASLAVMPSGIGELVSLSFLTAFLVSIFVGSISLIFFTLSLIDGISSS